MKTRFMNGNGTEPLPGTRDLLAILGGAALGYVVVRGIMERRRSNPEDDPNARCPLEEWYGGMPSGGNFEPNTEYEIGASRIAEAAHCILGSLEKGLSRFRSQKHLGTSFDEAMSVEREHIVEEMELIDKCMREYSKPLYDERILPQNIVTEPWLRDEYRDNALRYAQRSVEHIRKNAPRLKARAEEKMAALESCAGVPAYVLGLAHNSYQVIRQLASQMGKSVEYYPERVDNAYRSRALIADVCVLRGAVRRFLEATEEDVGRGGRALGIGLVKP